MKRVLVILSLLLLAGCSSASPITTQTPRPSVTAGSETTQPAAPPSAPAENKPQADPPAKPVGTAPAPKPVETPPPAAPAAPVTAPAPTVSTFAGLTVERYPLGNALPDETSQLVPALYAKRLQWRRNVGPTVDRYNQLLAPLGYRITVAENTDWGGPVYTLYKGETVVHELLHTLYPLAVNARGDDFALVADTGRGWVLIRPGQAEVAWDMAIHEYTTPVFAGNDLVTVVQDDAQTNTIPGTVAFSVWRGKAKAYSMQFPWNKVTNAVWGLQAWQNHWVLEVDGDVIIDGKSLKAEQGYDEVFNWREVAGKPFYFAVKGGKTSAVYDGQVSPDQYDAVPHYACCSPGMYNAGGNSSMIWFYGKQGTQWSYVEMGTYNN